MKQILTTLLVLLFLFQNLYAGTIKIPSNQPTIQVGIVSSSNGDTILVSPGTYYENINFNGKNIVLGSLFLTTGDTSYISQTIIDGGQQGCVVVFESGEDSTATLIGFTITNGLSYSDSFKGGGITCTNYSSPTLTHLLVKNNEAEDRYGGGILCKDSSRIILKDSDIFNNISEYGGGIAAIDSHIKLINNNIEGNISRPGGGIYMRNSNAIIEYCKIRKNTSRTSSGGGGILITKESEIILRNSQITENQVFETAATISPPNGGGIEITQNSSAIIEDCIISNNTISSSGKDAGGICVLESALSLKRTKVIGNSCGNNGAGVHIFKNEKEIIFEDVIISNNNGGGLYFYVDYPVEIFQNITIKHNIGHGIETNSTSFFNESFNFSVFLNRASDYGSDIYLELNDTNFVFPIYLDTTTVSEPDEYHIFPIQNIELHYNHALFQSTNSDLYVSANGSDLNSGISEDVPLKTINTALLAAKADSLNHRTIHLSSGVYSSSTNGEKFPIYSRDYISIKGQSADSTIFNGDGTTRIIEAQNKKEITFEDITIQNGYSHNGGGMEVSGDKIVLKNLIISNNIAESRGGGLNLYYSGKIDLINLTVSNNISKWDDNRYSGGLHSYGVSNLSIINSIVTANTPINLALNSVPAFFPFSGLNTIIVDHSNIEDGEEGIYIDGDSVVVNWLEGNIDKDPLFVGGNPFDYNLTDSSPCINAGTPFFVWEGDTLINLSPSEYIGEAPDMGALESDVLISVEGEDPSIDGLPTEFKLEQNYPNPFGEAIPSGNPSTTIKYSIAKFPLLGEDGRGGLVTIKVYDILGREVTTLVNKVQKPGNYEVTFDANNLSSGLYFYRITATPSGGQTDGFMKTMKMILLK